MAYIRGWVAEPEFGLSGVKFDKGKGNLVRVSGEFEISELKLTELKWLKSEIKSKGMGLSSS